MRRAHTHTHSFHLSSLTHICLSHSLSHTNFHSHKVSPSAAASLWANSVCIPFQSHLWETDKTICQITLAESHSGSHTHIVQLDICRRASGDSSATTLHITAAHLAASGDSSAASFHTYSSQRGLMRTVKQEPF